MAFKEIECGLDPSGSGELHMSSCEYNNKFPSSTESEKLFSHLSDYQFRVTYMLSKQGVSCINIDNSNYLPVTLCNYSSLISAEV